MYEQDPWFRQVCTLPGSPPIWPSCHMNKIHLSELRKVILAPLILLMFSWIPILGKSTSWDSPDLCPTFRIRHRATGSSLLPENLGNNDATRNMEVGGFRANDDSGLWVVDES